MKSFVKRAFVLTAVVSALGSSAFLLNAAGEPSAETPAVAKAGASSTSLPTSEANEWNVGELRPDGLRLVPSPPHDASRVLDPQLFAAVPDVERAYWIATQIPEVLNQLYCWCACEDRGQHRSNLACFEDGMGVSCDVCRGTAEIAYEMVQAGITDAARIQAAVDAEWAPRGA